MELVINNLDHNILLMIGLELINLAVKVTKDEEELEQCQGTRAAATVAEGSSQLINISLESEPRHP